MKVLNSSFTRFLDLVLALLVFCTEFQTQSKPQNEQSVFFAYFSITSRIKKDVRRIFETRIV